LLCLLRHQLFFMATDNTGTMKPASGRGFASMDPEKQRQIARQGGRAAHEKGKAHQFSPEEARAAGKKGGEIVSRNREHMSLIGKKGGEHSRSSRDKNGSFR
jgi:general stress protein YciG